METQTIEQKPKVDTAKILGQITGKYVVKPCTETYMSHELSKNHDGAIMFGKAFNGYFVPYSNGIFINGLTPDEEVAFETALNMKPKTLSRYPELKENGDPKPSYWSNYQTAMILITREGTKLDCDNNIHDKLRYKMLLACSGPEGKVVTSRKDVEFNPNALWIVENEEVETNATGEQLALKLKAFGRVGTMDIVEMKNFFKIYRHRNINYKVGDITKSNTASAKIMEIADKDPATLLDILNDENFQDLVLLEDLVAANLLRVVGMRVLTPDQQTLGDTKLEAVQNLRSKDYQDTRIALVSRLEAINKK